MLILKIKKYIIEHPRVSLLEISQEFDIDSEQVRFMLKPWVEQGKLDKFTPSQICGSCNCCSNHCTILSMELYTWKGE